MTAWPTATEMTLAAIAEKWGHWYHLEYAAGMYRATRPDGIILPLACTPEGLDSAIRADWSRWHTR